MNCCAVKHYESEVVTKMLIGSLQNILTLIGKELLYAYVSPNISQFVSIQIKVMLRNDFPR